MIVPRSFSSLVPLPLVPVLTRSLVLTLFGCEKEKAPQGAFFLLVLIILAALVLSHDLVYGVAIAQHQVIWIHTAHV